MTREEAINMLRGMKADNLNLNDLYTRDKYEALNMAIKALEEKPFINKPCVSTEACKYDKNKVLDKLKADIEEARKCYEVSMDYIDAAKELCWVLEIIDKYKAESEDR